MSSTIDFVLPYLDPSDQAWQADFRFYNQNVNPAESARFRDWGWLRFWLRSIERYAPWVHRIFILSSNPRPDWLDDENERIRWVDHRAFIPEEFLPVFCANTIELNLHRIEGLSEQFVYFNDDMLLNAAVTPDFYFRDGLPVDATAEALFFMPHCEDGTWGTQLMEFCDVGILKRHFVRSEVVRGHRSKWFGAYLPFKYRLKAFLISWQRQFINFNTPHFEKPLLKSVFEEVWNVEPEFMRKSCTRFREDASANVYLMRLWHLASNRFYPDRCRLEGHYYPILPEWMDSICEEIEKGTTPSICLNDVPDCSYEFYLQARERLLKVMERKYPKRSGFEK